MTSQHQLSNSAIPIVENPHMHGPELMLCPAPAPIPTAPVIPNQALPYHLIHPICIFTFFDPSEELFVDAVTTWFSKIGNFHLLEYNHDDFFNKELPEVVENFLDENRKIILHNTDQPCYPIIFFNLKGNDKHELREWLHKQPADHFEKIHCMVIANDLASKWVKSIVSKFHINYTVLKRYLPDVTFDHLANEFKALASLRLPYGFWHKVGKVFAYPFKKLPFRKCLHDSNLQVRQGPNYKKEAEETKNESSTAVLVPSHDERTIHDEAKTNDEDNLSTGDIEVQGQKDDSKDEKVSPICNQESDETKKAPESTKISGSLGTYGFDARLATGF
jgi:hypothetical protein